tara:strand:- start:3154 stop:3387 length:234 start_codon:yes stop_codon:yes gene_type:complete
MKIGDLIECIWQPETHFVQKQQRAVRMPYNILGEIGIIIGLVQDGRYEIVFPKFGHIHRLASYAFILVPGSRNKKIN